MRAAEAPRRVAATVSALNRSPASRQARSFICHAPPKSLSVGARQKSGRGPVRTSSVPRYTYDTSAPRARSNRARKSDPLTSIAPDASRTSSAGAAGAGGAAAAATGSSNCSQAISWPAGTSGSAARRRMLTSR